MCLFAYVMKFLKTLQLMEMYMYLAYNAADKMKNCVTKD